MSPRTMRYLGLDIGGANLKAADGLGRAVQVPFPLWKHPERLADELRSLLAGFHSDGVAVTMTGELCDCFPSKTAGVRHILESLGRVADGRSIRVWTTAGFRSPSEAAANSLQTAAANWLALATFAGRFVPESSALLIDLGSTTCDVVPLSGGRPLPRGTTDPERLGWGELVYCGVRRTPLCAVFGLTKAAEWFATTEDVYVALGELPERPDASDTADGRPMTKSFATARLARMECDEPSETTPALARQARDIQVRRVADSVQRVAERLPGPIEFVVMAGAGEFLIPSILDAAGLESVARISLAETLGPDLSTAACAHAVAVLAGEME